MNQISNLILERLEKMIRENLLQGDEKRINKMVSLWFRLYEKHKML